MNQIANFPFKLLLKTKPDMFKIENFLPGVFNKIFIQDSVFQFHPYLEFTIVDTGNIFTEENFFVDGIDLEFLLSDLDEKEKIEHTFFISEYQLVEFLSKDYVSGVCMFPCLSNFKTQDSFKSESYEGTIHEIVRRIMSKYKFPQNIPKMEISNTSNFDKWYQNSYDYEFIKNLSKYALSPIKTNSPFISFINMKGEFFFRTLSDLFEQKPVEKLFYGLQKDINLYEQPFKNNVMFYPSFQSLGSPTTMKNLNKRFFHIDENGKYKRKNIKLDEKLNGNRIGLNKFNIRKNSLNKLRDVKNFGIVDDFFQKSILDGWMNSFFLDSLLSFRMKTTLNFNPKICSGKVVETNFLSIKDSGKSKEYSGKWLVLETIHFINSDGTIFTQLELGKSTLDFDRKHKFFQDFL